MAVREPNRAASPDDPREPALDRAYAAGAREEPPSRLDAAILAAARREVHAGPRPLGTRLRGWRAPVALAAVLVLSVTAVLLMREEGVDRLGESPAPVQAPSPPSEGKRSADEATTADRTKRAQSEAPRAAPEVSRPAPPKDAPGSDLRDAPAPQPAPAETDRRKEQASPGARQESRRAIEEQRPGPRPFAEPPAEPKLSAPEVQPPTADALAKQAQPGSATGQAVERAEREQRAPAPPAAVAPEAAAGAMSQLPARAAKPAAPDSLPKTQSPERTRNDIATPRPAWQGYEAQPPEKWLERVEELHRAGRSAEARDMLAEFRKRFPQYPVPATLDR